MDFSKGCPAWYIDSLANVLEEALKRPVCADLHYQPDGIMFVVIKAGGKTIKRYVDNEYLTNLLDPTDINFLNIVISLAA